MTRPIKEGDRVIVISIDDWIEEYNAKEPDIPDDDSLIEARKIYTTGELARMVLAARKLGLVPAGLIDTDKACLYMGAQQDISAKVTRRKKTMRVGDREIEVREFVAWQPNGDDHEGETPDVIVDVHSQQAVTYAERYLLKTVTGHIHNHLAVIAVNKGDVQSVADALIAAIRGIVDGLFEG